LGSCVAVLSNLMLFGVHNQCQPLRSLLFSLIFCLINIGAVVRLECVCMFWCHVPTCTLYCIVEELDCCFSIFSSFKGNV
jgi:hypothetical protein